jgi:hypothetical protein
LVIRPIIVLKMNNTVSPFLKLSKIFFFLVILGGFVTIGVFNQQHFSKDLSYQPLTAEIILEASTLNLVKEAYRPERILVEFFVFDSSLPVKNFDGKVYIPFQNRNEPNIFVYEHFNIPPPFFS